MLQLDGSNLSFAIQVLTHQCSKHTASEVLPQVTRMPEVSQLQTFCALQIGQIKKRSGNIIYRIVKLHVQMLFVLLACNKMCLSMLTVMLIGFGTTKSHNYPTMRSVLKKNLRKNCNSSRYA